MWIRFWLGQLAQLIATVIGWFLLIPFCLAQAWSINARSIKDGRPIDTWKFSWLNAIYGNPEDGVSGGTAVIWRNGMPVPYRPNLWSPLRALLWSGFRNSCDNLKYVFSLPRPEYVNNPGDGGYWIGGPMKYWWKFKFGYQLENGYNVPVVGLK